MNAKPYLADLPLEMLMRIAREATQRAARDAAAAGREVAGWKDGRIEVFGAGAHPLSCTRPDPEVPGDR